MNISAFHSNGKLLISGEYLVLDGAMAMAVPTKYGQRLDVSLHDDFSGIRWEAFILNKGWLHVSFGSRLFNIIHTNDQKLAIHLKYILKKAFELGNITVDNQKGILIRTNLDFDKNWGLGSSSTLLSNIGYWLDVDPYSLSKQTSNGSGFDVAAARSNSPIFYQLVDGEPKISSIDFQPSFKDQLYFVHLNSKENSEESVNSYKNNIKADQKDVSEISGLSRIIAGAKNLIDFDKALLEHENILSKVLGIDCIKKQFFSDFQGEIKSLGAWGGDFVMATYKGPESNLRDYFNSKGKNTILRFDDMIL
ncbi:MAG: GYDIA family GHMP kinase [Bacteroidales bacterium]|nr:GYDIA family GHMP kinase [Bacteroidales bacterium]